MKNENFLSLVLVLTALFCVFCAILIFMFPFQSQSLPQITLDSKNDCVSAFKSYGWTVEYRDDESIKVRSEGLHDYENKLIKASTTQCPYMTLEEFCLGFECEANNKEWQGMMFTMRPKVYDDSNKKRHPVYEILGE